MLDTGAPEIGQSASAGDEGSASKDSGLWASSGATLFKSLSMLTNNNVHHESSTRT